MSLLPSLRRLRPSSKRASSAATLAVVSEVNPDGSKLFLFFWLSLSLVILLFSATNSQALPAFHSRTAMNNAIYQNSLIEVTPMLFHHLDLGMNYQAVINTVGKVPLYCDSGYANCSAHNGVLSRSCIENEFLNKNSYWMCHWDGARQGSNQTSSLQIFFLGDHVTHITATTPNGTVYRRDSANSVHLDGARS